jgi:hypothetical protein
MSEESSRPPAPAELLAEIEELAATCERHVKDAVGVALDGTIETLPVLDHYLELSREAIRERPELLPLLSRTIGAYFGRVVAGHFEGFWWFENADVHTWFVCMQRVFLALNPVGLVHEALAGANELEALGGPPPDLRLAVEDRDLVQERLAALPPVADTDFWRLSVRVEGLEVAVAALREQMLEGGLADVSFEPSDYDDELSSLPAYQLN